MAENLDSNLSIAEAATRYFANLSPSDRQANQQEVNRFVRWYGSERPIGNMTSHEVESYAEGLGSSVMEIDRRLEPLKAFLTFARKDGLTVSNLASSVKVRKNSLRSQDSAVVTAEIVQLTPEGLARLEEELQALKGERPRIAEALRLAMADKDFRENAPLDAAREHQGMVEARIRELEAIVRRASVLDGGYLSGAEDATVTLGCTVAILDLANDEEMRYTLVHPNEARPAQGKISVASPTGKALLGRAIYEVVEVEAPSGILRYKIEAIEQ